MTLKQQYLLKALQGLMSGVGCGLVLLVGIGLWHGKDAQARFPTDEEMGVTVDRTPTNHQLDETPGDYNCDTGCVDKDQIIDKVYVQSIRIVDDTGRVRGIVGYNPTRDAVQWSIYGRNGWKVFEIAADSKESKVYVRNGDYMYPTLTSQGLLQLCQPAQ